MRSLIGACRIAHRAERWHGMESTNHEPNHPPSRNHLRRPNTDMDLRDSLSRLKKDVKLSLTRKKREPGRTGADTTGEARVNRAGSPPQSEPHPDAEGREVGQEYLHPHPGVEVAEEGDGAKGGKVERVHPTSSIPHREKPNRAWARLFRSLYLPLIAPSDSAGTPTVQTAHEPEFLRPNQTVGPSATADKNEPNWKSTASATAKLILRTVNESSDAFPPLKSVVGGLCAILENSEVWTASRSFDSRHLQ